MRPLVSSLALLLVLSFAVPAAADRGEDLVEALVTVRFDPDSRAVVWPEIQAVLEGSPLEGWEGEPPAVVRGRADAYRSVVVERADADETGVLSARVRLHRKADQDLRMDGVLDALVRRLERQLFEAWSAEQRQHRAESERLRAEVELLTRELEAVRREGALPWPLSAATFFETLLERRHEVRGRLLDLEVEERGLRARRQLAEQRVARLRAAATAQADAVSKAWEVVLKARETMLVQERALLESGQGHPIDVAAAEESLARARLERAEMAADPASVPFRARMDAAELVLESLDADLGALEATRAALQEIEARLEAEIDARRENVLAATYREEELRLRRDRLLELQEGRDAATQPQVRVIRLD